VHAGWRAESAVDIITLSIAFNFRFALLAGAHRPVFAAAEAVGTAPLPATSSFLLSLRQLGALRSMSSSFDFAIRTTWPASACFGPPVTARLA
jgi:hypothetical protein